MSDDRAVNPLKNISGFPRFSAVRPEHVRPAIEEAIAECRRAVRELVSACGENPTWENLLAPLEEADDRLTRAWSVVSHLNAVCNTPELRAAHDGCLPLLAEYSSWAGQYRPLYDALVKLRQSAGFAGLTGAQRKAVLNSIRDFRLSGVDLDEAGRRRYAEIAARLSSLQSDFANHVLDATRGFRLRITERADLAGLPPGAVRLAASEAREAGEDGWTFTLDLPSYIPFLTYCDRRELRRRIHEAYVSRASETGPGAGRWDNTAIINEILGLRHELARLLGFESYAHLSLATKTAGSPARVIEFLTALAEKSHAQGLRELEELKLFAAEHGADYELEPWDTAYWSEKLRQERYSYNAEELRPYFPVSKVISGLFECAGRLYGICFRPRRGLDLWHEQVLAYDVYGTEYGERVGTVLMDLYARPGKRGGAWMDECLTRRVRPDGTLQLPVTYLVCNFTRPVDGGESQLTHTEVVTLFHEFGHALNHLLTRVDVSEVSGINGVPWDVVELPSQFNENFAWQKEALPLLSAHVKTGASLPEDRIAALIAAKNFQSALAMLRQLEFALFDFRIHLEYDPAAGGRVREILSEVRRAVCVVPVSPLNRFANSFTHVFAGGYAAGYYSYKWAEVLAADAFGRFLEEGVFSPGAGADFKRLILASGGASDPLAAFISFRGREPQVEALLRQSGIGPAA